LPHSRRSAETHTRGPGRARHRALADLDRRAARVPPGAHGARPRLRMAEEHRRPALEFQERAARLRPVPARRSARPASGRLRRAHHAASWRIAPPSAGDSMKLYGFWRSLATYRVKVALALKGIAVDEVSIDPLQGRPHDE